MGPVARAFESGDRSPLLSWKHHLELTPPGKKEGRGGPSFKAQVDRFRAASAKARRAPAHGCSPSVNSGLPLVRFTLFLKNDTRRRVGLAAADTAPKILPNHRCLSASRLEFAGRKESRPYLLASDNHWHQAAARHSAFNLGHWRVLATLDHHHALTSKAWNFLPINSPISSCFAAPGR